MCVTTDLAEKHLNDNYDISVIRADLIKTIAIIKALDEQLLIQRVMYWRDIDKEMPPEHEKVLVLLPDDLQLMAQMDSNGGWGIYWADGQKPMDNDRPVLKWMPLPACT